MSDDYLTTGEVATMFSVATRTVAKWVDSGRLKGWRIPGSGHRRISKRSCLALAELHGIPIHGGDASPVPTTEAHV